MGMFGMANSNPMNDYFIFSVQHIRVKRFDLRDFFPYWQAEQILNRNIWSEMNILPTERHCE